MIVVHYLAGKEIEVFFQNTKEFFSWLTFYLGPEGTEKEKNSKIFLETNGEVFPLLETFPEVDLKNVDKIHLVPEVAGEIPVPAFLVLAIQAGLSSIGISAGAASIGSALAAIGNIAIMTGISMISTLLTPNAKIQSDPAQAMRKQSNLFNGSTATSEQGGPVPLCYGTCYAIGVPIFSTVETV